MRGWIRYDADVGANGPTATSERAAQRVTTLHRWMDGRAVRTGQGKRPHSL